MTPEPFEINDTLVYSPGWSGERLSRLDISYDLTLGQVVDYDFELLSVDDSIAGDATIQAMVKAFDSSIIPELGVMPQTPIVEVPFDLPLAAGQETAIGNLVADAMRTTATMIAVESSDPTPADAVGFFSSFSIADGLYSCSSGTAALADLYNVLPYGRSLAPGGLQHFGWPLISFCVTPADIKVVAEMSASVFPAFGSELFVNISGFRVEYDPSGPTIPADRVRQIWLCGDAVPESLADQRPVLQSVVLRRYVNHRKRVVGSRERHWHRQDSRPADGRAEAASHIAGLPERPVVAATRRPGRSPWGWCRRTLRCRLLHRARRCSSPRTRVFRRYSPG